MTFARIRPPGNWTDNSTVGEAEWEAFDNNQSKAIDGSGGGAYAPTNPIEIGGSGMILTGPLVATELTALDARVDDIEVYLAIVQTRRDVPLVAFHANSFGLTVESVWRQSSTSGPLLRFHVPLPLHGTITGVTAIVEGGSGHVALPSVMPQVALAGRAVTIGATSFPSFATVSAQSDASGSIAAYELVHAISLTGLSIALDGSTEYAVDILGESGANSIADALRVGRVFLTLAPA